MNLFSLSLSLFLLMDSIGNIPVFLSVLKKIEPKRQRYIIFRELFLALLIITGFYFVGNSLLELLHISQPAVLLSGGVILFIIGIRLVFLPSHKGAFPVEDQGEPFLVPLAIPLVSGPAVLAAVILYSRQDIPIWTCLVAIFIAWAATTAILLSAVRLKNLLGDKGLSACEKLTGLLLIMIAIQMLLDGIAITP